MANDPVEVSADKVSLGVESDAVSGCSEDHLWAALKQSICAPGDFFPIEDLTYTETSGGYTCREYMLRNQEGGALRMREHCYTNLQTYEVRAVKLDGAYESDEENVFAIRREPLRLEFFTREVSSHKRLESTMERATVVTAMEGIIALAQVLQRSYGS